MLASFHALLCMEYCRAERQRQRRIAAEAERTPTFTPEISDRARRGRGRSLSVSSESAFDRLHGDTRTLETRRCALFESVQAFFCMHLLIVGAVPRIRVYTWLQ